MINVSYILYTVSDAGLEEISEADAADRLSSWGERLADDELDGAVVLEAPGQSRLEIVDELWAVVQNLCFRAVHWLLEGEGDSFVFRLTSQDGTVVVLRMAIQARIFGDHIPALTARIDELAPALYACGARYLRFLEQVGGQQTLIDHLRPFEQSASEALARPRNTA
jgi:hypothetical protein